MLWEVQIWTNMKCNYLFHAFTSCSVSMRRTPRVILKTTKQKERSFGCKGPAAGDLQRWLTLSPSAPSVASTNFLQSFVWKLWELLKLFTSSCCWTQKDFLCYLMTQIIKLHDFLQRNLKKCIIWKDVLKENFSQGTLQLVRDMRFGCAAGLSFVGVLQRMQSQHGDLMEIHESKIDFMEQKLVVIFKASVCCLLHAANGLYFIHDPLKINLSFYFYF